MTIRALRSEHAYSKRLRELRRGLEYAVKRARIFPGRGWGRVVARLNREIMFLVAKRTAAIATSKDRAQSAAPPPPLYEGKGSSFREDAKDRRCKTRMEHAQ